MRSRQGADVTGAEVGVPATAGPTYASVELIGTGDELRFTVSDSGVGST